jgi:hypothetical protein
MKKSRETIKLSKVTVACIALLVANVVLYLYFLNMSVVQVVMRTEHIQQLNQLNTEIALLESQFIQAQHEVASQLATLQGFDTETEKIFVSREQASLVLGGN